MGVTGLQWFASLNRGSRHVDILFEIQKWKSCHNNDCLLVFDLMGLVSILKQSPIEAACGYRYWVFLQQLDAFLHQLRRHGARLIFFDDGPPLPVKFDTYNKRQTMRYEAITCFHDQLNQGVALADIVSAKNFNSGTCMPEIEPLMDLCQRHGQVNTSYDLECDLVLAKYATEHNALAVLAEDSDFLIFPGNWQYWSTKSLSLDAMKITEISRTELTNTLGIHQNQMGLLATLSGNDIINPYDLRPFHSTLGNFRNKFPNIANYMKRNSLVADLRCDARKLQKVAVDMNKPEELIRKSLAWYDVNCEWVDPTETPLFRKAFGRRAVYHIMLEIPRTFSLQFCDLRFDAVLPLETVWIPLYRRQIGIVLRHESSGPACRKILTRLSKNDTLSQNVPVQATYPENLVVPSIEILLNGGADVQLVRHQILAWMLTGKELTVNDPFLKRIAEIVPGYVTILSTLWYLVKVGQFSEAVADGVLQVEIEVRQKTIPTALTLPTHIKSYDLNMVKLYARMHESIRNCLIICGLSIEEETLQFDSVYYHILQNKSAKLKQNLNVLPLLAKLRSFYIST